MDDRIRPADLLRRSWQADLGAGRAVAVNDGYGGHRPNKPAAWRFLGIPAVEPRKDHRLMLQQVGLGAAHHSACIEALRWVALELGRILRRRTCLAGALLPASAVASTVSPAK